MRFMVNELGQIVPLNGQDNPDPCQAVNLAVNNAMLGRLLALEKGCKMFFLKRDQEQYSSILGRLNFDYSSAPVFGLLQNARMTNDGYCRLVADLGLGKDEIMQLHND